MRTPPLGTGRPCRYTPARPRPPQPPTRRELITAIITSQPPRAWSGHELALQLQVNRTKFEALPLTHQVAIETACTEENARALAEYNARSPAVIAQAITQQGVELKQFPADVFKAFGSASGEVLSEIIAIGDDLTKRIAASYLSFRQETLLWTRIGDQGYANMRLLDYAYPKGA